MGKGTEKEIREALYERFIVPFIGKTDCYAGVEFELPIYNTEGGPTDYKVVHGLTDAFIEKFGADDVKYDDEGFIYFAGNEATGDLISFDCSYNTFEIAFGKEESLRSIGDRFNNYFDFACEYLRSRGHTLVGMGINPGYKVNRRDPVANGRYRMLLHHLESYKNYPGIRAFHDVPYYGLLVCAAQTHIDASSRDLIRDIRVYEKLEPLKGLLFANSPYDGGYLCVRDHFWRESMHGFNPYNVDCWGDEIETEEDIISYISRMSLFCTEREEKYINFKPITVREYVARDSITGEYYDGNEYRTIEFTPEINDIDHLRSYKFADLTFRGTIELRSACMQPAYQAMSVPAFNLGVRARLDEFEKLLSSYPLYHYGYSPDELRKMSVMYELPDFMTGKGMSKLLLDTVDLAREGLVSRGFGEERYLEPLYDRAEQILSPAREMTDGLRSGRDINEYIARFSRLNL